MQMLSFKSPCMGSSVGISAKGDPGGRGNKPVLVYWLQSGRLGVKKAVCPHSQTPCLSGTPNQHWNMRGTSNSWSWVKACSAHLHPRPPSPSPPPRQFQTAKALWKTKRPLYYENLFTLNWPACSWLLAHICLTQCEQSYILL